VGFPGEAAHGDVLVPKQVADYSLAKIWPDGRKEIRWKVHRASANLLDSAVHLAVSDYADLVAVPRPGPGEPVRRSGVIASGGDVVSNDEIIAQYRADWPKLIGIEMEGGGTSAGLHETADRPEFLMVKAVSDHGKDKKDPAVVPWRAYACDVAAAFAIGLLRSGPRPIERV
jgi:nucleoside phosphorylase